MLGKIKLAFSSIYFSVLMFLPNEFSKYRVRYYNRRKCSIHKSVSLAPNTRIKGKVEIGKGSSVAQNCSISGENEGVFIGQNVMIAPNVVIVAFSHGYKMMDLPMSKQKLEEVSVHIEDDVWIASNVTIGKGVRIGKGSIVGANSLVIRDVEPYSIVGGVPAQLIRQRT